MNDRRETSTDELINSLYNSSNKIKIDNLTINQCIRLFGSNEFVVKNGWIYDYKGNAYPLNIEIDYDYLLSKKSLKKV